jgi:hypothetical protein
VAVYKSRIKGRYAFSGRLGAMTPLDTSQTANDTQLNILRKMTGIERLRIAIDLSELARNLAFTRIEKEHPGLSRPLLIRQFLRCILPEDRLPRSLR